MLLVISEGSGDTERIGVLGAAAAAGGAWGLLIREPLLGGGPLLELTCRLRADHPHLHILISDRLDAALAAGAYGVQLGERAVPVDRARSWVGDRLRLGRSVHDLAGARRAVRGGADWLVLGNIYETRSKPGRPGIGTAELSAVTEIAGCPVFAIGGIDRERVVAVQSAGAAGVAVIGAVARAPDPTQAVADLVQVLRAGANGREGA